MIAINKNGQIPEVVRHTDEHNHKLTRIFNGHTLSKKRITPSTYRHSTVRNRLSSLYKDKCAYCETKDPEFEIEHYRPKRGVKDEDHHGYYWLSYEWTNLLPACHDCNKTRSKATKFPILGERVINPIIENGNYRFEDHKLSSNRLKNEMPLLINPEEEGFNPFDYFQFHKDGLMIAKGRTSIKYRRANATINDIIRLNRDKLYLTRRKNALRRYEKRLKLMYVRYLKNYRDYNENIALDNLKDSFFSMLQEIQGRTNRTEEYSFFWNYVFINIFQFLPNRLKSKRRSKELFYSLIEEFHNS